MGCEVIEKDIGVRNQENNMHWTVRIKGEEGQGPEHEFPIENLFHENPFGISEITFILRNSGQSQLPFFQLNMLKFVQGCRILTPKVLQINGTVYLKYDLGRLESLRELVTNMREIKIGKCLKSILISYLQGPHYLLDCDSFLLDPDLIFFDEENKEDGPYLIYLPRSLNLQKYPYDFGHLISELAKLLPPVYLGKLSELSFSSLPEELQLSKLYQSLDELDTINCLYNEKTKETVKTSSFTIIHRSNEDSELNPYSSSGILESVNTIKKALKDNVLSSLGRFSRPNREKTESKSKSKANSKAEKSRHLKPVLAVLILIAVQFILIILAAYYSPALKGAIGITKTWMILGVFGCLFGFINLLCVRKVLHLRQNG